MICVQDSLVAHQDLAAFITLHARIVRKLIPFAVDALHELLWDQTLYYRAVVNYSLLEPFVVEEFFSIFRYGHGPVEILLFRLRYQLIQFCILVHVFVLLVFVDQLLDGRDVFYLSNGSTQSLQCRVLQLRVVQCRSEIFLGCNNNIVVEARILGLVSELLAVLIVVQIVKMGEHDLHGIWRVFLQRQLFLLLLVKVAVRATQLAEVCRLSTENHFVASDLTSAEFDGDIRICVVIEESVDV